ncbi:hypothetical protein JHK85_014087 [Glycine max]|nr:hypothetical protein JHK85_014087 [Glycine max]
MRSTLKEIWSLYRKLACQKNGREQTTILLQLTLTADANICPDKLFQDTCLVGWIPPLPPKKKVKTSPTAQLERERVAHCVPSKENDAEHMELWSLMKRSKTYLGQKPKQRPTQTIWPRKAQVKSHIYSSSVTSCLKRCGKSCRLRWLNYLRPHIKHGGFTHEEDQFICSLYATIGTRQVPSISLTSKPKL